MNIQFLKKDAEYIEIDSIRKSIASITSNKPTFISIVLIILIELNEASNNLLKELDNLFELSKYMVDKSDYGEYDILKNLLEEYYILISDFNFDTKLRAYNFEEYKNYKLSNNQNKMNTFRGILFEAIVEQLVVNRFENCYFETGCLIYINKHKICIYYDNGKRKETFDIAGWNATNKWGEFYECKIRPDKFKKENYLLLQELKKYLVTNSINSYKIIIASADSVHNLLKQIEEIVLDNSLTPEGFECYGKENLHKINEISMPIIA